MTKDYRTKTIFTAMDNHRLKQTWPIGLDIGYSSVKVFSGNMAACFPAYAEEDKSSIVINPGELDENSIQYKDEDGVMWNVGAAVQNNISVSDATAGSLAIYGRNRYYSPMFKVIARVGIAAGMQENEFGAPGDKKVRIQTGLPPKYIKNDTYLIKDALKGHHKFQVRFGAGPWKTYEFTLSEDDIGVIDQPMGTLMSIATDKNIRMVPDAAKYFRSRLLILDPGFGTFDIVPMISREVRRDNCQTFDSLGMKQVLADTAAEIFDKYHFEIPVPAIQRYLETGEVIKRDGRTYSKVGFDDILEKHSRDICNKALEVTFNTYNPALEYDYIVVTGGTGAAWRQYIEENELIKNCLTVQVIDGNNGDKSLPYLFSNVRGYYILLFGSCIQKS